MLNYDGGGGLCGQGNNELHIDSIEMNQQNSDGNCIDV